MTIKKILSFLFLVSGLLLITSCVPPGPKGEEDSNFHGTIYQIFVRSFADSDGDGIGDLNGITEKLDYLKDLNVDALWLMPIQPNSAYHGYEVTDYYDVNPEYGTLDDFDNLVTEANKVGIDIILDMVYNHTSNQHPWFQAAMAGDPTYQNYYIVKPASDYTNQIVDGKSVWHLQGDYCYYAYYFYTQPDLNFNSPTVQDELMSISRFWAERGVAGFRLDGAMHYYEKGEYTDRVYDWFDNVKFLQKLKNEMTKINPSFYLMGEVWETANYYSLYYYGLDSLIDFDISDLIMDTAIVNGNSNYVHRLGQIYDLYRDVKSDFISAPFLRNHDMDRVVSTPNMDTPKKVRMAGEMLLTLPGNPIIYYGEEIGMKGFKWNGTDDIWDETRRLPLPWGDSSEATWFVSNINNDVATPSEQVNDPNSLLRTYQRLLQVREDHDVLKYGNSIEPYENNSYNLQGYYRSYNGDRVLILHNFGYNPQSISISGDILYFTGEDVPPTTITELPPKTTVIVDVS